MRKTWLVIGVIGTGLGLLWLVAVAWGGTEFFKRSIGSKHRLVANLLCEDPVTTFLSVVSLDGVKVNPVTITLTDADGLQINLSEDLKSNMPMRVSCETIPAEFSQEAPVVVHLDSRHPTSGVVTHVLRGSPIQGVEGTALKSS